MTPGSFSLSSFVVVCWLVQCIIVGNNPPSRLPYLPPSSPPCLPDSFICSASRLVVSSRRRPPRIAIIARNLGIYATFLSTYTHSQDVLANFSFRLIAKIVANLCLHVDLCSHYTFFVVLLLVVARRNATRI